MRTIRLYGSLAERFGAAFRLEVRSLAEACLALGTQLPGFRRAIEEGRFRVTCGPTRRRGLKLDEDLITFGLPAGDLHIVPVVKGAKSGNGAAIGKIIVGTLIVAATFWMGVPSWLLSIGVSLALSGASALLAPKKKAEVKRQSYMAEAENTADQGGPVPLIIGTCLVGSVTVSAGVATRSAGIMGGSLAYGHPRPIRV